LNQTEALIAASQEAWSPFFVKAGVQMPTLTAIMDDLVPFARRIVPLLTDTVELIHNALDAKKTILFEGAQGTLLDVDHGTYPFVTSSSAVAAGACTCSGIGPKAISKCIGITKAYTTRVGAGPFPTELTDGLGEALRRRGAEFGSVTGRSRRTGWLDITALRFAARVNGLDSLIVTKLDVLSGIGPLKVCVAYESSSGRFDRFPVEAIERGESVQPIYEEMAGWTEDLGKVRRLEDLPKAARKYLAFIEKKTGLACDVVSVGPGRDETIVVRDPFQI
jgi:adenylosuccinate synthase